MVEIPKNLQDPDINFVLLKSRDKIPFQKDWQNKEIKYNDSKLLQHISNHGNFGIRGGGRKNLIILDFDSERLQKELLSELPETFTVKTGSGLLHLYYYSNGSQSFKLFDENLGTLADIQGTGKQCVGPGSTHPNGCKYKIVKDVPITFLDYAEIQARLMPYDRKPKKEKKVFEKPKVNLDDDFIEQLKSRFNMSDVLVSFGIDIFKNPTECPMHSSKGGQCLGFDHSTAHCFHCNGSWNIFSLVKDVKNCDFPSALEYLAKIGGLEEELKKSKEKYIEKKRIADGEVISDKNKTDLNLPIITLPRVGKSISEFSNEVITLLENENVLFFRPDSREIVEVGEIKIKDKLEREKIITGFLETKPKRFVTLLEQYGKMGIKVWEGKNTQWIFRKRSLNISTADIVLASDILEKGLPKITRIFSIPLPIIYKGELTFPKKGYDKRFNSWLPKDSPDIKEMELKDAKKLIDEIFKEFCFNLESYEKNRVTAIAGLLSPFLRGLYSEFNIRSPLFIYKGNRERTGKDYCAGITGIVYEGEDIQDSPISTGEKYGNDNEELRKKFTGALSAGRKRMHFSNCKGHINNSVFEKILTNTVWRDRKLGVNTNIQLPNEMDFSLSGNVGLTYERDLAERSRFINLFYGGEHINERTFEKKDLHGWLKKNREEIISALYALVKNWVDKESPPGSLPFSSFPEWAEICGGIMEAAGYESPCKIDKDNEEYGGDIEKDNMKQIFEIGYEEHPNEWIKNTDLYNITSNNNIYSLELPIEKSNFIKDIRRYQGRDLSGIKLIIDTHLKRSADHSYKFSKLGEKTTTIINDNPTEEERRGFADE